MKIAFFVTKFPTLSETFIANQIIALQNSGHIVHIFSQQQSNDNQVHEMVKRAGLLRNTFYLNNKPSSRSGKIISLLSVLVKHATIKRIKQVLYMAFKGNRGLSVYDLIHYLDKPDYDVVHAHFGQNGVYVKYLRQYGIFSEAKFITTFHGYDMMFEPPFYQHLFESDVIVTANSEYSKKQLLKLNCPVQKINILPVGLNIEHFTRGISFPDVPFRLLFVGRLVPLKAPDFFVRICKELVTRKQIKFRALIVGDGELRQELEQQITNLGLNSVIELAGAKTQEEIKTYMANSDVFILPGITDNGRAETQGLVIQEAQAMKLPVIVSDAGGMKEGVLDVVTGFVLPQNDLYGFVDKIEQLALDNNLRETMGAAGRKFIERAYDSKILNEKLLSIYDMPTKAVYL
jgi:colanic acid/amylovoran biosynthesis glycosyltransferase